MRRSATRLVVSALLAVFAAGCGDKGSSQLMAEGPRYEPLEAVPRAPVPGTVARGHLDDNELLHTGMLQGREADVMPFPATRDVLDRGRERFDIFCSPCHGRDGYGEGVIVQRGFTPPPSFHTDQLRRHPLGHFVRVMTLGYGAMPQYAKQLSARDRWAIAAYIRALQLSQHAVLAGLPASSRARFGGAEERR
jgi:mono/diheme cytochrome c family protein